MKFVYYSYCGEKCVGVLNNDRIIPIKHLINNQTINTIIDLIEIADDVLLNRMEQIIESGDVDNIPFNEIQLLAPIPYPRRNIICLGKNYLDHINEIKISKISDTNVPDAPIYFTKIASPAIGSGDDIFYSKSETDQVDYEAELAVVIGRTGKNIMFEDAEAYIFGYTIINDVTARDMQARHKQWFKGKSMDTFCPMGPAIVHKSEIPFPVELNIQCRVNGELRQDSNTKHMIFSIANIISDLSQGVTLKPGDIICTGTPSGVGMGFQPPRYLKDGDVIECSIEKIGKLINTICVL